MDGRRQRIECSFAVRTFNHGIAFTKEDTKPRGNSFVKKICESRSVDVSLKLNVLLEKIIVHWK